MTSQPHQPSMFSSEGSPAKTYPWLDSVLDWLDHDLVSGTSSPASLLQQLPVGFSSKTSLDFCRHTEDETLESSSAKWRTSGMGGPTGSLTLNTSVWPNDAAVSSLSDILEDPGPHLDEYCLSQKACQGILRRAGKRGKKLPALWKPHFER